MVKRRRWTMEQILSGALALLGFAGCNTSKEIRVLYGTPSVDYRVTGKITEKQGNPLKNVQLVITHPLGRRYVNEKGEEINDKRDPNTGKILPDTLYTDKKGKFTGHQVNGFSFNQTTIDIQDIDGTENGGLYNEERVLISNFDKKQTKKQNGFYQGEFEFTRKIQLTKRNE